MISFGELACSQACGIVARYHHWPPLVSQRPAISSRSVLGCVSIEMVTDRAARALRCPGGVQHPATKRCTTKGLLCQESLFREWGPRSVTEPHRCPPSPTVRDQATAYPGDPLLAWPIYVLRASHVMCKANAQPLSRHANLLPCIPFAAPLSQ